MPAAAATGIVLDCEWEHERLWRLPLPVSTVPVRRARVAPAAAAVGARRRAVRDHAGRGAAGAARCIPAQHARILAADLAFPLDLLDRPGRPTILDGVHRLARAVAARVSGDRGAAAADVRCCRASPCALRSARLGAFRIAGLSVPQTASSEPEGGERRDRDPFARSAPSRTPASSGPSGASEQRDRAADALHPPDQPVGRDRQPVADHDRVRHRDRDRRRDHRRPSARTRRGGCRKTAEAVQVHSSSRRTRGWRGGGAGSARAASRARTPAPKVASRRPMAALLRPCAVADHDAPRAAGRGRSGC